jgi:hypothetical protein
VLRAFRGALQPQKDTRRVRFVSIKPVGPPVGGERMGWCAMGVPLLGWKPDDTRETSAWSVVLVQELFEELSGSCPHCGSSSVHGISKELLHARAEGHVASRKIRQSFESEGLNDRTAIFEVAL